jgi:integrase
MPKPRATKLETATARRRLAKQKKPYWITISPGIGLGYRANAGPGTWSVRSTDGHGRDWVKRLALADDFEAADGGAVLTYWQALDAARKAARGADDTGGRPVTVNEALDQFEADLRGRGGDPGNAARVRAHMTAAIGARLVSALNATELRQWRDALSAKGLSPAAVNRTCSAFKATFSRAAAHDERITNARAWRVGLAGIPGAFRARNKILTDAEVLRLIECAYAVDRRLGIYVEVAAVTGARGSQIAGLTVADLQADRLMMPTSRKGRGLRTIRRFPVPIPPALALALAAAAAGRDADAPLLLDPGGRAWGRSPRVSVAAAVAAAGLGAGVTPYALRHSSIVRQLKANTPIRIVASLHDTSVGMIERTYSAHIAGHSDDLARRAMLDPARAANVISIARRP